MVAPKSTPKFGDVKKCFTIVNISLAIAKAQHYKHLNIYDCSPTRLFLSLHEKLDRLTELVERNQSAASSIDWLESEDARKLLGVSPKTWQNYRDQRLIPFSQIGRKIYVSRADLDAFLRKHRIASRK